MNNQPTFSHVRLDLRVLSILLLVIIGAMLCVWQPWHTATAKTVTVRGQASVEQAPDLFGFRPIYVGASTAVVTAKGNEVVARLKVLGIKEADIKTEVASYGAKPEMSASNPVAPDRMSEQASYTITAATGDKVLAQKVADYLGQTGASGQITPRATFSKATQTKLELAARRQASADAKAKAMVLAEQLGGKIGRVTKISEDTSYGVYSADNVESSKMNAAPPVGPTVQPGTNEVAYAFTVVFELK